MFKNISLLRIKKASMRVSLLLFAPMTVRLNIPWPEAYRFMGYKYLNTYKKLRLAGSTNVSLIKDVQQKTISYLEKYVSFDPRLNRVSDWIDANFRLSTTFLSVPAPESIDQASQVARRVEQFRRNISVKYNIPESDIAFIPRQLAVGSFGVYENLEAHLKAMAMGLAPVKKLFLLVDPKSKVNNPCYLNYWAKYVTVVTDAKQIKSLEPQEKYPSSHS